MAEEVGVFSQERTVESQGSCENRPAIPIRDRNLEIRFRRPREKTKPFAVISQAGLSFKLDFARNAKAAELVWRTGKQSGYEVAVTGGMSKHIIQVESISLTK